MPADPGVAANQDAGGHYGPFPDLRGRKHDAARVHECGEGRVVGDLFDESRARGRRERADARCIGWQRVYPDDGAVAERGSDLRRI